MIRWCVWALAGAGCVASAGDTQEPPSGPALINGSAYPHGASLFLQSMLAHGVRDGRCTSDPRAGATPLDQGLLDLALRDDYLALPFFIDTAPSGDATQIDRLEVDVREGTTDGPRLLGREPYVVFGPIPLTPVPTLGTREGVVAMRLLDPEVVQRLRREVCVIDRTDVSGDCPVPRVRERVRALVVRVTGSAVRLGGGRRDPVQLPTYAFALSVCCGCSVSFPQVSDLPDAPHPGPDCLAPPPPLDASACFPGQDFLTDCRRCARDNHEFCQPRGYQARVPFVNGVAQRLQCPEDR
jgi:hypothetical protein